MSKFSRRRVLKASGALAAMPAASRDEEAAAQLALTTVSSGAFSSGLLIEFLGRHVHSAPGSSRPVPSCCHWLAEAIVPLSTDRKRRDAVSRLGPETDRVPGCSEARSPPATIHGCCRLFRTIRVRQPETPAQRAAPTDLANLIG